MKAEITEKQFKEAAEALLPAYIKSGKLPYRLDAYGLLYGGYCISYVNGHLEADVRQVFHEIWDDPLDCIKAVMHRVRGRLDCEEISEEEFHSLDKPHNKLDGLADKIVGG